MIATEHVSVIEFVWVLVALVGLVYSLINIRESQDDFHWLDAQKIANGRRTLARYQLWAELLRALTQAIFLVIGVLSLFLPNPPDIPLTTLQTVTYFCIRWGLVTASLCLTIKSYLGHRVRQALQGR